MMPTKDKPLLVGLVAASPGAGKDTFYYNLSDIAGVPMENIKFADKLDSELFKHFQWVLSPADLKALRTIPRIKDEPLNMLACARVDPMTEYSEYLLRKCSDSEWFQPRSMRWHLIEYGTHFIREHQGKASYWLDAGMKRVADSKATIKVVTDVRFPNEAEAIKKAGGLLVFIDSPWNTNDNGAAADGLIPKEACHLTYVNPLFEPLSAPEAFLAFLKKGPYSD